MKHSLYHDLVTGIEVNLPSEAKVDSRTLLQKEAVVFHIGNVSDFMYEKDPRDTWMVQDDFPNIAPQFEWMWFEWNSPRKILIGEKETPIDFVYRSGVMIGSVKTEDGFSLALVPFSDNTRNRFPLGCEHGVFTPGSYILRADKHGRPQPNSSGHFIGCITRADADPQIMADAATMLFCRALLAISLMHCKNVQVVEHAATRQAGSRQRKRGDGIVYHTLNIEPMKRVLHTEGGMEKNGLKLALHICRGHFKDYSQGNGLFGKLKGLFWWDDQVRGSADHGETRKDYNVKPD